MTPTEEATFIQLWQQGLTHVAENYFCAGSRGGSTERHLSLEAERQIAAVSIRHEV